MKKSVSNLAIFLLSTLLGVLTGCERTESAEMARSVPVRLNFSTGGLLTRSGDPDEEIISDLNLWVFNAQGGLEERLFLQRRELSRGPQGCSCELKLLKGGVFSIYACANLGYQPEVLTLEQLQEFRYWLNYPDDFAPGLPMGGKAERITAGKDDIDIILERFFAKVALKMDRSRLDEDVILEVAKVSVGNCPRSVNMFSESSVRDEDDVFPGGYSKERIPCSVYLLENLRGKDENLDSYIEIKLRYDSDSLYTREGNYLTYRFHLGEIRRNCSYTVTVIPEGDGLGGVNVDNWRIERGDMDIHYRGTPWFKYWPAKYIEGRIGDKIHVWCDYYPPDAPFDIGLEELEYDRERGIYDYEIDPDGKGVVVTLKNKGSGMLYFWADEPVDDGTMVVIVCEP